MALKLIIEMDRQHDQTDEGQRHDARRDAWLTEQGFQVLRIQGYLVPQDPAGVRHKIERAIDHRIGQRDPLTPDPSPPAS